MAIDKVGRYAIKDEIGRGGMATVYLAHDPVFERDVAVKLLPREFLHDPTFKSRFEREAKTIASLEHSAIVPVHDFGEEKGQPYLVMRYMPGGSLVNKLKKGRLPFEEILHITTRLASGLDEAHRRGMIHRDLKPGNILFDNHGDAYLSDFGIVKLTQETTTLTGGGIIGTPAYMSPEQAKGDREIDSRSDIYALGVILFEMLTGKPPYEADTPVGLVLKHITDPIPRITKINPELPPGLDHLIERALCKEADERYSTTGELAAALKGILMASTERPRHDVPTVPEEVLTFEGDEKDQLSLKEPVTPPDTPSPDIIPISPGVPELAGISLPARLKGMMGTKYVPVIAISSVAFVLILAIALRSITGITLGKSEPTELSMTEGLQASPSLEIDEDTLATRVAQTILAGLTPTQTPVPPLRIYDFHACLEPCLESGANAVRVFPEKHRTIYVQWRYENIPIGAHYIRTWSMDGREWVRYECSWPGPEDGLEEQVTLTEPDGLHSGEWVATISVDGDILLSERIWIEGDWDFWEPAGYFDTCYGKR